MDLGLKGKRVLVQGASQGLGRAVARTLVEEGAIVTICARDAKRLEQAASEIGAAYAIPCDLSVAGSALKLVADAQKKMGGAIDVLVTNTGGPPKGHFWDITPEQWMAGFQGLWMSATDSIRAALPAMREQKWGRVLLITSVAAREPMPLLTVSNGLRAGLLGLTRSISHEVAPFGITINALLPGYTETERLRELAIPTDKMTAQIPAGRLGQAEELGALAAFLASEKAGYITGQAIACDGGYLKGI